MPLVLKMSKKRNEEIFWGENINVYLETVERKVVDEDSRLFTKVVFEARVVVVEQK